jgi:hypothetical protein
LQNNLAEHDFAVVVQIALVGDLDNNSDSDGLLRALITA